MDNRNIPNEHRLNVKAMIAEARDTYIISPENFKSPRVKRGLRNADGTGVVAGVTGIGSVHGYIIDEGEKIPQDGKLYYRGYDLEDIVSYYAESDRFGYEEVSYLLLMGKLPTDKELDHYNEVLNYYRNLPPHFVEDMILKCPAENIMNKMMSALLALYTYDDKADDCSFENVVVQSSQIIARMPIIAASAYSVKRHVFQNKSLTLHYPKLGLSTSENFLRVVRSNKTYTKEEAKLLDLCLILHAEHGGGNNSTFTCRSLSSTGTDTYSAIAGALGALKGPKHGGANIAAINMLDNMKSKIRDVNDDDEIAAHLEKIIAKEENDRSGLIYGMGHAVYTKSDPRARILKKYAKTLTASSEYADDFKLLEAVERIAPSLLAKSKPNIPAPDHVCANVDLYSGTVFRMLKIPTDMFTPLFAIARTSGWCAHRMEEMVTSSKIYRPAFKTCSTPRAYVPLSNR